MVGGKAGAYWTNSARRLDSARRRSAYNSSHRCNGIQSCYARRRRFRHFGTVSAVGRSKEKPSTISMPGATRNFSTSWVIPAVVVPVGHSPEGLPIGVQIVGRPWEEEQVLAVAAALEKEMTVHPGQECRRSQ